MTQKSFPLVWTVVALVLLIAESLVVATMVSPVHWLRTVLLFLVLAYTIFSRFTSRRLDDERETPNDDPAAPVDRLPRAVSAIHGLIADP